MSARLALGAAAALAGLAALRARQGSRAAVSPLEFLEGKDGLRVARVSTLADYRWLPGYQDQGLVQIELGPRLSPAVLAQSSAERRFRDGATAGYIQAVVTRWGLWEMESVEAQHGYGPLLYDLLLELAYLSGASGVVPDRSGVSDEAERVWDHYAEQRSDVEAGPLPDDYPERDKYSLRWRPNLDRVYTRSDVSKLRALVDRERLQVYDPGHVLDLDYDELDIKMSATGAEPQR
jgi:hypothetical protein